MYHSEASAIKKEEIVSAAVIQNELLRAEIAFLQATLGGSV